ncbi:MAG: AsmA family protein [Alphaproteobacteria bacterium]|nr:MAG: AsmA family protein [Alphaproteobacteria bacterium]
MMKRIVATLFFLSLILVAVALVAPGFIDWSQHKERIIAQLKPYLGRQMTVGGQVKFQLIPNPEILLEDVTLSNAEGAKADNFMKLKQLEARIKFQPLLQGRFEVESINLAEPALNLEILDDGSANWTGILKEREEGAGGIGNAADTVQFNQITMTDGMVRYLNQVTGAEWRVDKLNLAVSADTLFGPYRITGDMQYKGAQVQVEAGTGKLGGADVPLTIAFNPVEGLPQVKLDGTMDTQSGLNMKGDLFIAQGNLASLFDSNFLKGISFLNDEADVTGALDVKGGEAKLDGIKAKFGKKGEASGSVVIAFEKGKKPVLTADLAGSALKVTSKPGFMEVPDGFSAHLKLKGKNISWGGASLPGVSVNIDTDKEEWVVKNARFDLPGKSVVKLAGVVTPKTKYAAYSVQVTTEDLPVMLKSLPLADGNILKVIESSGIVKKLDWSSSLDLRADKVGFADIDAKIGDKMKLSGVLGIGRGKDPSFKANLNVDEAGLSREEGWKAFLSGILKAEGDIEIAAKNLSLGDMKLAAFSFNGKSGAAGLQIKDMSGTFADGGEFKTNGTITALSPATGIDLVYNLKTENPGAVATALGVNLPPPLKGDMAVDIHGHIGGDAKKYTFNTDGHGIFINGTAETGEDGVETYLNNVKLENGGGFAMMGLPIDRLAGAPKDLSGELKGTATDYRVSNIDAGGVSGWISRKDGKYEGELTASTLDFDGWLWNGWSLKDDLSLKLKAKKLLWHSDEIIGPSLTLEAGPDRVGVSNLSGQIWGGDMTAEVSGKRKGDAWSGTLKGRAKGVDLGHVAQMMEFRGFTAGNGDLDFDLKSDGEKEAKEWFHGMDGTIGMRASAITIESFAPAALPDMLSSFKKEMQDLPQEVLKSLHSGDTKYDDVAGTFSVSDGKITIVKLLLTDAAASVDVQGDYDLSPETFQVTGNIQLKSPPGVPSFAVSRSGKMENAPGYTVNVKPLLDYFAKRQAKDETKPAVEVAPLPQENVPPDAPKPLMEKPLQLDTRLPEEQPLEETGTDQPEPPSLPKPEEDEIGVDPDAPIETEQLDAPQPPAPPETLPVLKPGPPPAPAPAQAPAGDHSAIKGILDRLKEGEKKPAAQPPAPSGDPDGPPPEEELLPKE